MTTQTTEVKEEEFVNDHQSVGCEARHDDPLSSESDNGRNWVRAELVGDIAAAAADLLTVNLLTVNEQGGKLVFGRKKNSHSFT